MGDNVVNAAAVMVQLQLFPCEVNFTGRGNQWYRLK